LAAVVTLRLPAPPAASIADCESASATEHFNGVGVVGVLVELQLAIKASAGPTTLISARIRSGWGAAAVTCDTRVLGAIDPGHSQQRGHERCGSSRGAAADQGRELPRMGMPVRTEGKIGWRSPFSSSFPLIGGASISCTCFVPAPRLLSVVS